MNGLQQKTHSWTGPAVALGMLALGAATWWLGLLPMFRMSETVGLLIVALSPIVGSAGVVWALDRRRRQTETVHAFARWAPTFVAALIVAVCVYIGIATAGWGIFLKIFYLPVLGTMHLVAHSTRSPSPGRKQVSRFILIGLSHVLFIAACLLQWDEGDGPGWLTITELFGQHVVPAWWGGDFGPQLMNFLVFLPVLPTWVLLIRRPENRAQASHGD